MRYIELPAVSEKWPCLPMAPPLGELASGARLRGQARCRESWREAPERATHAENTTIRADFIYILLIFLVILCQKRLILQKMNRPKEDRL